MAPIKRQRKKSSYSLSSCIKFIVPLFIGIMIGMCYNNLTTENELKIVTSSTGINSDNKSGWHPINVYFGKPEALKLNKPPMQSQGNANDGSQVKQDQIIMKLYKAYSDTVRTSTVFNESDRQPYFVDLAANDASALSNTYNLEKNGWNGLCVEPNPVYWFRLAHRKCIVAGAFVGGKADMTEVDVVLQNKEFGGITGDGFDNNGTNEGLVKEKRLTVSIKSMFQQFNVPTTINYLSLDVEGAEELIMNEFPFDLYTIQFMTIERPKIGLQELLKKKNYRFVGLLVSWGESLWVHESVFQILSLEVVNEIVSKTKVAQRKIKKGQNFFDIKSGTLLTHHI